MSIPSFSSEKVDKIERSVEQYPVKKMSRVIFNSNDFYERVYEVSIQSTILLNLGRLEGSLFQHWSISS